MPICSKCGKEYSYGSYHHIHCGIVYKDDRKAYGWNCVPSKDLCEIKERIIESFMKPSKIDSLYTFE
jgi:hypothetical protein